MTTIIAPFLVHSAAADVDVDSDGVADVITVTEGGNISWQGTASSDQALSTSLGAAGDIPVPARWLQPNQTSLAVVHNGGKNLTWSTVDATGAILSKKFGVPGDYIVSGGDFNGDGIADGAIARVVNLQYQWTIFPDLLAGGAKRRRPFIFCPVGGRLLYLRPTGTNDWVGCTRASKNGKGVEIALRNPLSKRTRTIRRLPAKLLVEPRPRPFPVRGDDGLDVIGFSYAENSNTEAVVFNLKGKRIAKHTFPGVGPIIVGDFDASKPGEEIYFLNGTTGAIFNPFTNESTTTTLASTIPSVVDEYRIAQVVPPTPTPTATPVITATATATATPIEDDE